MMKQYLAEEVRFDWAGRPGRLLQRELDDRGMSQAQLALHSGLSTKHVNLVIKGHAALSADVAIMLEQILDVPAETWLRVEADYRANEAREERREALGTFSSWIQNFPREILVSRHLIESTDDQLSTVDKLLKFFGVTSPAAYVKTWLEPQASYKRGQSFTIDPHLTALWLCLAERKAESLMVDAPAYDAAALRDAAAVIPSLSRKDVREGFPAAQGLLKSAGVGLVFVPEIDRTRISGVSRWIRNVPVVAVTSRYKTIDSLWFALLHEIAHVLLHPKRSTFIDHAGHVDDDADRLESAANKFAAEMLVPAEVEGRLIGTTTVAGMRELAGQVGVGVGVLAGRRAFLTNAWGGPLARLRERGDLADILGDDPPN